MGDLTDINASQSVKIAGASSTGTESNYVNVTSSNAMLTDLNSVGNSSITLGQKTMTASVPVVLASDQIVDTSQGYLNNNNLYSAGFTKVMTSSATDNPLMLIRNPIGSGKDIFIQAINAGISVTNVFAVFKVWSTPTVTANGTAITTTSNYINNGASASVGLINSGPTVSSNGTLMKSLVCGQNNNSIIFGNEYTIGIKPGGSILVTGTPSSNNRAAELSITYAEK